MVKRRKKEGQLVTCTVGGQFLAFPFSIFKISVIIRNYGNWVLFTKPLNTTGKEPL